tara:strand:- start:365 stop:802 length:438 start_codon:yes stop_codon:yes gene_type:complete
MPKFFKIFFIIIFLFGCGYSPIFSNQKNINIDIVNFEGDRDINNLLSQKLTRYKSKSSEKNYKIKTNSKYDKKSLTKDAKGDSTNYRLSLEITFNIAINNITKTIILKEEFDMKKGDTVFEEENYEKFIIENMIDLIIQKLIQQL